MRPAEFTALFVRKEPEIPQAPKPKRSKEVWPTETSFRIWLWNGFSMTKDYCKIGVHDKACEHGFPNLLPVLRRIL